MRAFCTMIVMSLAMASALKGQPTSEAAWRQSFEVRKSRADQSLLKD